MNIERPSVSVFMFATNVNVRKKPTEQNKTDNQEIQRIEGH